MSLERINSTSPYHVEGAERKFYYNFYTEYGGKYSVGFDLADDLIGRNTYQFYLSNIGKIRSPRDPKLRETLMSIIYEFFENNRNSMLYICETGDGKQRLRNRLFEYWFNSSNRHGSFTMQSAIVTDMEGNDNYASIISRLDNPNLKAVFEEFTDTIKCLNDKPHDA